MTGEPTSERAPILTRHARYTWGDYEVEVREGPVPRMMVTVLGNFNPHDERSRRTCLEIDIEGAPDVVRLIEHALASRETRA